jgi:hypothetical protein
MLGGLALVYGLVMGRIPMRMNNKITQILAAAVAIFSSWQFALYIERISERRQLYQAVDRAFEQIPEALRRAGYDTQSVTYDFIDEGKGIVAIRGVASNSPKSGIIRNVLRVHGVRSEAVYFAGQPSIP